MSDLLSNYHCTDPAPHEMLDQQGQIRPHWQHLLNHLEHCGSQHLHQRQAMLERQIQENGVTYNVYADPDGADRPWKLDLLPHIIPNAEWQQIAQGVAQRARLLNAVMGDIYGEQKLLAEGLLPSDLVFGHNHYLWPCQGVRPLGDTWLHLYAVDLARGPDGRWWVTADRTQAPAGAGYALENRHLISRTFPDLYRDLHVRHLADYFRTLQDTLARQAPVAKGESPLVVLLTPGRFNESYFEHLYLARQLGYPLVEGSDLTVRDGMVYMKSLVGLRRVHAILRRLNDDFCDPLELRSDSTLGVPGLLDAVRRGGVLVANALGSGVLESPGLPGFLPAIHKRLFNNETLLLPSVASWWCGEPPVHQAALKKLSELLIRPAFPSQSFQALFVPELDKAQREALRERIARRPYAYVGQERPHMSFAPIWQDSAGRIEGRALAMRVFAVASGNSYRVMPGALSRVAAEADAEVLSMQRGGASKDTWVLGERLAGTDPSLWVRSLGVSDVMRSDPYLPSRIVENLYWFGRYCERSEGLARLLRIMLSRYIDDDHEPQSLQAALKLADAARLLPDMDEEDEALKRCLFRAILDEDWPTSLKANLQRMQWAANSVRGKLSRENWQALQELQKDTQVLEQHPVEPGTLLEFLDRLLLSTSAMSGFALDDMTRDDGWRFLMTGRRIERLQFICDSVACFLEDSQVVQDQSVLEWLLELGNSSITYRTRYLASPQLIPVLDLLLLDTHNPHAVSFQLRTLLQEIEGFSERFEFSTEPSLIEHRNSLQHFNLGGLESFWSGQAVFLASRTGLAHLLKAISQSTALLSDRLALRFFAHVDTSHQTQSL